jgi:hypothetical protein
VGSRRRGNRLLFYYISGENSDCKLDEARCGCSLCKRAQIPAKKILTTPLRSFTRLINSCTTSAPNTESSKNARFVLYQPFTRESESASPYRGKRLLASSWQSVVLSKCISASPTWISVKSDTGEFPDNLPRISELVKIGQKHRSLKKPYVPFTAAGNIKSP